MKKFLFLDNIKWQTWALLFLILVGTFLRTYNFHQWLLFGDDQVRDAYITNDVLTGKTPIPLTGPFMSFSGDGAHSEANSFHMGPIYYYFQIISAKIFGNYPDKLAYPDAFFSILSIPLFYFLLRIYFGKNLSLGITALYAVSGYFIAYSRFAWNTNLIPFFVILLLLSLYEFLEKNERTKWGWVLSLGFALGVGFQLHAIVMILFSIVTFLVFLFSMKRNPLAWKKWAVVLLVFLILNVSQIINEARTNFSNTKTLLHFADGNNNASLGSHIVTLSKLKNDVDCHIEANFFLLSSYGNEHCYRAFVSSPLDGWVNHYWGNPKGRIDLAVLLASIIFSILGYFFLIYYGVKEDETTKKYFSRLLIIYFVIGFLIMLPLSQNDINDFRYFVFGFFMPFLFLGFLIKFITQKFSRRKYLISFVVVVFCLLFISNVDAVYVKTKSLLRDNVTCSTMYKTVLGELEPVTQYMIAHSNGQKKICMEKDNSHRVMSDSLVYLLKMKGVDVLKVDDASKCIYSDATRFYVSCKMLRALPTNINLITDINFDQKIGQVFIYQLESTNVLQ